MEQIFIIASIWLALAVFASIIAYHLKISIALTEICVGVIAATIANKYFGIGSLGNNQEWLRFLAGSGAVLLTFLAGAELDRNIIKSKWKEVLIVGFAGFAAPFFGCAAAAFYILHWSVSASWLSGVVLAATSMAIIYTVLIETGFNKNEFGKGLLAASFVNDFATVIALGLLFAPFTYKTIIFIAVTIVILSALPLLTSFFTRVYGNRTAAIRVKWIVLVLFGLGALALWSGSEAVLPAYLAGIILAEFAAENQLWLRRLRSLTVGFLTPFYFIRAGSLVAIPALISAPMIFIILLASKSLSKIFGLYPVVRFFRRDENERWYYTLMMSTGLTFGTISALYGFSHGIINETQYSFLVAAVIGSAVIPTLIANFAFMPKHLLAAATSKKKSAIRAEGPEEE